MKNTFVCFFALLIGVQVLAHQGNLQQWQTVDSVTINSSVTNSQNVLLKANHKNEIAVLTYNGDVPFYHLHLKRIVPGTNKVTKVALPDTTFFLNVKDFYSFDKWTVINFFGGGTYLYEDGQLPQKISEKEQTYVHLEYLSDSTLLFWEMTQDELPGINMTVYNLLKKKVTHNKFHPLHGALLSRFSNALLSVVDHKIVFFNGINNEVYTYDFKLKPLQTFNVNLFSNEVIKENSVFSGQITSLLQDINHLKKTNFEPNKKEITNISNEIFDIIKDNKNQVENVQKLDEQRLVIRTRSSENADKGYAYFTYNVSTNELTELSHIDDSYYTNGSRQLNNLPIRLSSKLCATTFLNGTPYVANAFNGHEFINDASQSLYDRIIEEGTSNGSVQYFIHQLPNIQ